MRNNKALHDTVGAYDSMQPSIAGHLHSSICCATHQTDFVSLLTSMMSTSLLCLRIS